MDYIYSKFQWKPSKGSVTNFLHRWNLSSHKVLPRAVHPSNPDYESQSIFFRTLINLEIKKLKSQHKGVPRYWTMDCVKLPDNPYVARGVGPKGEDVYRVCLMFSASIIID